MIDIPANRRDMLQATAGFAGASLLGVLNISSAFAAETGKISGRSEQPLKAAFSNIGLQVSWCAQGKQAAECWGKLSTSRGLTASFPIPSSALRLRKWRARDGTLSPFSRT